MIKKIKFHKRLRFQLILIGFLLILIPLVVISLLISQTFKSFFTDKYSTVAYQSLSETGEKIDYLLNDVERYSTTILSNQTFLSTLSSDEVNGRAINDLLRSFFAARNDIDGISLHLKNGNYSIGTNKILQDTNFDALIIEKVYGKPFWLPTEKINIRILSGIFPRYYFSVARRIIDYNSLEEYGTLVIDIEEVLLEQAYNNLSSDGSEVFITDSNGLILSHPNKDRIGVRINQTPYYQTMFTSENIKKAIYFETDFEERVAFYDQLATNDWYLIKTISTDTLFFEINQTFNYFLIGGVFYGFLLILFLFSFSIRYTEPILKIVDDLKMVEQGDLTVRTKVSSENEMSYLSESINNMIGEIEILIDRLLKEERLKREVELEALHAQINPHFLYNTLNTIRWMAKIQGAESVSNAIVALVKLLRISINIGSDFIPLSEELEYIKNYIVIQKLRFNEDFTITIECGESDLELPIPKLILQPIIENAILYGVEFSSPLIIKIVVSSNLDSKDLLIEVIDNGPGIEKEIVEHIFKDENDSQKLSKAGLNNVNQRIKLFCGDRYGLSVKTEIENGTIVSVLLPVKEPQGENNV
ncbi:MAG: sensor histidine kinase [Clostridia bacterium]|nr:sensor histidine kinase [Clostridia bacterium]